MSIDKKAFGLSDSLVNAVSEALKGGQVKLDKNHNGKLDGQDFKMLRKEEIVDEGNPANKEKKNAAAAAVGAKNRDGQYLSRMNPAVADKIRGREKMSGNDRKQFEEVEQVDELSKKTMGSYIKKASHDVATKSAATGRYADRANAVKDQMKKGDYSNYQQGKKDDATADKMFNKSWKRRAGIAKATDKLTKEDVQVDEVLDTNVKKFAYLMKAKKSIKKSDPNDMKQANDIANRTIGVKRLMKKITKEEVVDEAGMSRREAGAHWDANKTAEKKSDTMADYKNKTAYQKAALAAKKKVSEGVEQVDELSTDTYHSAAKKAAKKAMGDAQGRSGPIFKKYAGMANKFRDKGMSQEKKEKAVKEAYDDNSSNVSDWSDKKLKWHKEKMSSSSAKAHSELVRRSKTGQAAPKKTNEETLDEIQGTYGNGGNKKNLKIIHKGVVVKDYGTDTKPNKASRDKKAEKMKAYRADRDKHMEEEIQIDEISKKLAARYNNKVGPIINKNQNSGGDPAKLLKRKNREAGHKLSWNKYHNYKVKVPATEETDPGFAEAAENPATKQLADKKAAIQKTIAQKKMQVMQSKANKQIASMKEGKCTCAEGKKSMTCEVCNDKAKGMKGGKEPIQMNPPLRD